MPYPKPVIPTGARSFAKRTILRSGGTLCFTPSFTMDQFVQVNRLQREDRVQGIGEAVYLDNSLTAFWISNAVNDIASRIVQARQTALREKVGFTPQHILTDIAASGVKEEVTGTGDQSGNPPKKPAAGAEPKKPASGIAAVE